MHNKIAVIMKPWFYLVNIITAYIIKWNDTSPTKLRVGLTVYVTCYIATCIIVMQGALKASLDAADYTTSALLILALGLYNILSTAITNGTDSIYFSRNSNRWSLRTTFGFIVGFSGLLLSIFCLKLTLVTEHIYPLYIKCLLFWLTLNFASMLISLVIDAFEALFGYNILIPFYFLVPGAQHRQFHADSPVRIALRFAQQRPFLTLNETASMFDFDNEPTLVLDDNKRQILHDHINKKLASSLTEQRWTVYAALMANHYRYATNILEKSGQKMSNKRWMTPKLARYFSIQLLPTDERYKQLRKLLRKTHSELVSFVSEKQKLDSFMQFCLIWRLAPMDILHNEHSDDNVRTMAMKLLARV